MFDLDGTLVHTAPEIAQAANWMLADVGKPMLPTAQVQSYIGEGAVKLIKRCLTGDLHAEPDAQLFETAEKIFFAHYANNVVASKPFDGVEAGLQAVQNKGYKLACVTNKPAQFTQPLLQSSGLDAYFEMVVSGDTLPKKKPDPMQLHHICAQLKIDEFEALLVGDSDTDVNAARAAGCFIITVPYGYNQGRAIDHSMVDATINDLTELTSLLTNWLLMIINYKDYF